MKKDKQPLGATGLCGSNDTGRAVVQIRRSAKEIMEAVSFLHYGSGCDKFTPLKKNHPIAIALDWLKEFDREWAWMANEKHDPTLFEPKPYC